MAPAPRSPLDAFAPLALDELGAQTALQDRVDTKYVLTAGQLDALLERLAATHRALDVGGLRTFRYRTTYYDTHDLLTYREHRQGRRRRFKCRRRRYLDTGLARLEVKLKGRRGRTVKHATPAGDGDALTPVESAFVRDRVLEAYGREVPVATLRPTLVVGCRRLTLAAPALGERVTCDVELDLGAGRLREGLAIVESKSVAGRATADALLRELGVRPVPRCSKYLLGIALAHPEVASNELRATLRRYVTAPAGLACSA